MRAETGAEFGSSPLARGLLRGRQGRPGRPGIIPARAGFTIYGGDTWRNFGDHPRSRGVYPPLCLAMAAGLGSSPLARGLRPLQRLSHPAAGIIPARAGFTVHLTMPSCPQKDHPRSRGVYGVWYRSSASIPGSSPLARGLHAPGLGVPGLRGIIPARAGFTLADPWNPNEPVLYQTPVAFTADLGPARRVVVAPPRQE